MASQDQPAATRACGACEGTGYSGTPLRRFAYDPDPVCPVCAGSGRVPGNLPATESKEVSGTP